MSLQNLKNKDKTMKRFLMLIFVAIFFSGCVIAKPNSPKTDKSWNELFDSNEWQPVNDTTNIDIKKAM